MKENKELIDSIKDGTLNKDLFMLRIGGLIEIMLTIRDPYDRANYFTNLMTAARYFDIEQEIENIAQKQAAEWKEPELWELPEIFDSLKKPAPFPMQNLPPLLREYLQAVSDYVQVVPEMGNIAIAVSSFTMRTGKSRHKAYRKQPHRAVEPLHNHSGFTGRKKVRKP